LGIGIRDNEFAAIEGLLNHVVHGIAACATHTENGDPWF
jgi:hypothetical protein